MNAKNLSFGFIVYAVVLLSAAAFSFWAKSPVPAVWLALAGLGIMTWAHFLNRRHYWGFIFLLVQLFISAAALGWNVLAYFQPVNLPAASHISETGFRVYGLLFIVTLVFLLLSA